MNLKHTCPSPSRKGFTIIEMLIVVTILTMLAGILVPILSEEAAIARDGRRASDLRSVASALANYKDRNGDYPTTTGNWQGDSGNHGSYGYDASGYIPNLVPDYIPYLPQDPDAQYPNATDGGYMYRSDGFDFKFVINSTAATYYVSNPFFDPTRPTIGWQVSSPGGYAW
ncbi:MAG: prepilin-type N-terminal cleavage/methylation domain-containing protein [Planctomycetota bacterium]|nr:prepilin-type N-terminal cleavage/methylation domain-containing protein [Planctomycetota bacterium]MDA1113555.1 prepilin-type N-terminal cleavage/methylation domain-containing protein [Planctomycetota bacterium]